MKKCHQWLVLEFYFRLTNNSSISPDMKLQCPGLKNCASVVPLFSLVSFTESISEVLSMSQGFIACLLLSVGSSFLFVIL